MPTGEVDGVAPHSAAPAAVPSWEGSAQPRGRWFSGLAAAPLPLLVLVFVGGVVSLGLEVSGPRLMAPYFGTTELIWATQIGFTLIYLAIGYYIGGRVADRYPDARVLCTLTTLAALAGAAIPFVSQPLLGWSVGAFSAYNSNDSGTAAGIFIASLLSVLLLFSVPTILLGMVSPFAVRLSVRQVGT
ncbi:MAG TPA: fused MFS/spermidine synthase, partial [Dehalococcoidia bacterium]|nr:fused MFS/spermidine synthase [Dehalococcoidia bacterium]